MPDELKSTWVSDFLHGTIALSSIEKAFISTQIFNRLHNILENSTVYFTYPSNRTSRFTHSLGCVNITGDIFCNSILNATPQIRNTFFDAAKASFENLKDKTVDPELNRWISNKTRSSDLHQPILPQQISQLYSSALPYGLTPEQSFHFVHLYQAVRLTALLHDVGHPPFSHVTENALTRIDNYIDIRCQQEKTTSDSKTSKLNELFKKFFRTTTPFHERLGEELAVILFDAYLKELKEAKASDKDLYFLLVQKHLVLSILAEKTAFYGSLHRIVDGQLDSDRLDYVQRDLAISGFSREPLRIDRLLRSFTLIKYPPNGNSFCFAPSIRAIHNLEEFYRQRFQLYKYLIYHHRVVKFDGLLEHCITELAQQYIDFCSNEKVEPHPSSLSNQPGSERQVDDGLLLRGDISGLWQVFESDSRHVPKHTESVYVQWDDAWLLSILRRKFFTPSTESEDILFVRLEEFLSNRKRYISLYKRAECFLDVDRSFVHAIPRNFDWNALVEKVGKGAASTDAYKRDLSALKEVTTKGKKIDLKDIEAWERLLSRQGYAITILCHLLANALGSKTFNVLDFLSAAATDLKAKLGIKDVFLVTKRFNTGVTDDFIIVNSSGRPVRICGVSRISEELRQGVLSFPPFFVFLFDTDVLQEKKFQSWRITFGKLLWNRFANWVKQ